MEHAVLHTEKLCKTFTNGGVQQHVIKNLDLEIQEGAFTVIMGSSGSGKSTLLYALSGMDKPTLGKVFFGDEDISGYTNDQLAVFRRGHCGFVFQSIYLLDNMTVFDNVMTGALAAQKNSPALVKKAEDLLKKVGAAYGTGFCPISGFGEDLSFCLRAGELGETVWVDSALKCGHVGLTTYTEDTWRAYRKRGEDT